MQERLNVAAAAADAREDETARVERQRLDRADRVLERLIEHDMPRDRDEHVADAHADPLRRAARVAAGPDVGGLALLVAVDTEHAECIALHHREPEALGVGRVFGARPEVERDQLERVIAEERGEVRPLRGCQRRGHVIFALSQPVNPWCALSSKKRSHL